MKSKKKLTPLMEQYWAIKAEHEDKVLLFRMGDFFEMFHDDAVTAAPILNIALTSRNKKAEDETPMCGVPHHSIAGPISKLLAAGHKVAICDQIEDPKQAKGIVKRAVTRILSPGMVYDPETLDQLKANYLCSFDEQSVAFLEASTGEAFYYSVSDEAKKERLIDVLNPSELVVSTQQKQKILAERGISGPYLTSHDVFPSSVPEAFRELPKSVQRLVAYSNYMQGGASGGVLPYFEHRRLQSRMELNSTVLRHLEIFGTYKGDHKGSLFEAINRTKTSSGARMLKNWMSFPLTDVDAINFRLDQVSYWHSRPEELKMLRQILSGMGDIERRLGKISNPNCNGRDLLALSQSLRAGLHANSLCPEVSVDPGAIELAGELVQAIEQSIVDEPPLSVKAGGIIQKGLHADLDELIRLAEDSQKLLLELEAREKQKTQIPSLKVRYNNVFGFYIEVTKTHTDKVPDHYKRKQTLTNAERYLTQELQELEDKILSAKSKRADLEFEIFNDLKAQVLGSSAELMLLSRWWSELDVVSALAWVAIEQNYIRPSFSKSGGLHLVASRHPVVEQEVATPFVPNSVKLMAKECLLLTGPNMAGKSTLMRQVAVTSILAQIGAFVPAREAILPVFDRIFTRIGASDYLAEGLSTFMVEMQETAEMLKAATEHSLVILDEVGRGTSTYDGMSLAQAILEFLVTERQAMTLFATHYHEMTQLDRQYPQIHNAHMSISEAGGEIEFLHTLVEGPANKSYGIHVAKLAGLPAKVTKRARRLLEHHETLSGGSGPQMSLLEVEAEFEEKPEDVTDPRISELRDKIRGLSIQEMTPIEALNQIAKWQQDLS